jgi:hypothetical protein
MYTTLIALLFAAAYFFGIGFIKTMIDMYMKPAINSLKGSSAYSASGFTWFISLVLINIIVLTFIIGFYYYKTKYSVGPPGPRGYTGEQGPNAPNCEVCDK